MSNLSLVEFLSDKSQRRVYFNAFWPIQYKASLDSYANFVLVIDFSLSQLKLYCMFHFVSAVSQLFPKGDR